MKDILLLLLLLLIGIGLLATGCGLGNPTDKLDNKVIYGTWNGLTYANALFNLEIEFDENWEIEKDDKVTSLVGWSFDATYSASVNTDFPLSVNLNVQKKTSLTSGSEEEELQSTLDVFQTLYEPGEVRSKPTRSVTIAGSTFLSQNVEFYDEGEFQSSNQYVRLHEGYILVITVLFRSDEDEAKALEFIDGIKRLK